MIGLYVNLILVVALLCVRPGAGAEVLGSAPAPKMKIGLEKFESAADLKPEFARFLCDCLEEQLVVSGKWTVVAWSEIERLLQYFAKSQPNLSTDDERRQAVMKQAGIQKMFLGSLTKIGAKYHIRVRVLGLDLAVDTVEKGTAGSEDEFEEVVKDIVLRLTTTKEERERRAAEERKAEEGKASEATAAEARAKGSKEAVWAKVEQKRLKVWGPVGEEEKPIDSFTNSVGMQFVQIPAGEFWMGSPAGEKERQDDEGSLHQVRITRAFFMGAFEVTQEQYERIVGNNPSKFIGPSQPVEQVTWDEAVEFCKRLSARDKATYRLPTEAEWEYACRAGTTTPFYFGATISTNQVNYDGDHPYGSSGKGAYREKTLSVGSCAANTFGLFDMHGNVWEWCQDWYGEGYYAQSPGEDPPGPSSASVRVLRGASWNNIAGHCRSAYRGKCDPSMRLSGFGFRVVRECVAPST